MDNNEKNKSGMNRIALTISVIVLVFGLLYGFIYFNKDKFFAQAPSDSNKITEKDKQDKDVEYEVKTLLSDIGRYEVIDNKYLKVDDVNRGLSFYTVDGEEVLKDYDGEIFVGLDKELYKLEYRNSNIVIEVVKNGKLFTVKEINISTDNWYKVIYTNDSGTHFLVGVVFEEDSKDYLYKLDSSKTIEYVLPQKHFIGDLIDESTNTIYMYDPNYIIVTSGSRDETIDKGVYSFEEKKITIDCVYENIESINNGNFIVNIGDKASIVDGNLKSLTIPYDFIMKRNGYYLVARDGKFAIFDKNFKVLTDFEIPFYGFEYIYSGTNNIRTAVYKDKFLVMPYEFGKDENEIYVLNNKKLSKINLSKLYVDNFIYSFDDVTRNYNIFSDDFELLYSINVDKYFNMFPISELSFVKFGDTLILSNQSESKYFNFADGEEIKSIKDYEISYTDSIKLQVKNTGGNMIGTLVVGDKEFTDLKYSDYHMDNLFRKISNNYYLFADNKILKISKKVKA